MADRAISTQWIWDFPVPRALEQTQGWVLRAMQHNGRELVTMLWRILGNEQDVCDAYQDTFLKLAHAERGNKPKNIKAYVFRSASNAAVSLLRRRFRHERIAIQNGPPAGSLPRAANELDAAQLARTLRAAIAMLPEHYRDVVTLHDLGDLSYEQTAKILGITAATTRVYRCRAVRLLAAWMRKEKA